MRKKIIKRINNQIAETQSHKKKYVIKTKIMYDFLWRQIIKDISQDGVDIGFNIEHNKKGALLYDISTLNYFDLIPIYFDFDELQKKFSDDGIVIKKYSNYDPFMHRYNYQIKYTLDELKKIINNKEKVSEKLYKDNKIIETYNNYKDDERKYNDFEKQENEEQRISKQLVKKPK